MTCTDEKVSVNKQRTHLGSVKGIIILFKQLRCMMKIAVFLWLGCHCFTRFIPSVKMYAP
jgi:hypothetical protein